MKTLAVTLKDLQIFLRDPGSLVGVFVLPIVFILIFGGLGINADASEKQERAIDLPVVNLDSDSPSSLAFIHALDKVGGLKTRAVDQVEAQRNIDDKKLPLLVTIPAGFGAALENETPVDVAFFSAKPNSTEAQSAMLIIDGVARSLSMDARLLASLRLMGEMNASAPPEFQVFTPERLLAQAESQMKAAEDRPLVVIKTAMPTALAARGSNINQLQLIIPGFTVLFAYLAAQVTARSIYDEKKVGSLRRLLAAPLSKSQLLAGKLAPNLIIVLVQIAVIFAVGVFIMPLLGFDSLNVTEQPLALVAVSLCTAICSTSLGILIAALARTAGQINGVASLILWIAGLVSGAIVPLYLMNSPILTATSKYFPQTYSVIAFYDVMVLGYGVPQILFQLGMLLVFSLIFFTIGVLRFRFD